MVKLYHVMKQWPTEKKQK